MRAFLVRLPSGARYWTVLDENLAVVGEADVFLWKAPPFPDCGNGILSSRYLRFQELIADLLRRPVPVR